METILLGVPTYTDISINTHLSIVQASSNLPEGVSLMEMIRGGSLLCRNFNALWCDALNLRAEHNARWFVMLHGDMASTSPDWLLQLLHLAEAHKLDALSVMSPIKDGSDEVSTALYDVEGRIERFALPDLWEWPETFSADYLAEKTGKTLLINTGMLAMRLDRPWCEEFAWSMVDEIWRTSAGQFVPRTLSEDWVMSLWFRERNIPYGATRAIPVIHAGNWLWTNEVKN